MHWIRTEPLITGNKIKGSKDRLVGNQKSGYSWAWRQQAIEEDNGFWLAFMPLPKGLGALKGAGRAFETAAEGVAVEQYALRAADNGFYPVMRRGFRKAQELQWLNRNDVWKFGTTKNPLTRYSQSYLDNLGEYGVKYTEEFTGTLSDALELQNMKILNYKGQSGFLPPGNKIIN